MNISIMQIAYVVEDLDDAVRTWGERLGVGPWSVWTLRPPLLKQGEYKGRSVDFSFRHALAWNGAVQLELIQPLNGPSIFADQLAERGPGVNHLGARTTDFDAARQEMVSAGYECIQGAGGFGRGGDGRFAYFALPGSVRPGEIIELIAPPEERVEPDYVFAPNGEIA